MTESPVAGTPVTGASETGASETGSPETTWDEAGSNQTAFDEPGFEEPEFEEPGFEEPGPQVEPEAVAPEDATPEGASSGDPSGQESIVHPRVWQRRVAVLREQAHRRLRWVVAGVAVLVALCVAVLALHTPLLALRHATVRGAEHTGTEAVLQAAGLLDHPPLIDVDPDSVATRVEKLPWVAHAVVVRRWPDSVTIIVTERVSLGTMARPGGGVAVVDSSGRVLAWQADAVPGLVLVAPVTPGRPGTVLARAAHPALQVAAALPPVLAGQVLEVSANAQGMVTLELGGGISAVLGSTDGTQAKLTALASVLAGAHVSGPAVIDVTVPDEPTVGPPPPGSRP